MNVRSWLIRFLVAATALAGSFAHAETFIVPLNADAYVDSSLASTRFGSATALLLNSSPQRQVLLSFNTQSLAGKEVVLAKLKLYVRSTASQGYTTIYPASRSWTESTVRWNNRPPTVVGPSKTFLFKQSAAARLVSISVTDIVRAWADGSMDDFGFVMTTTNPIAASFDSKERPDGIAPVLEITTVDGGAQDQEERIRSLESSRTESFHSDVAAASNGWTLVNGIGNWGWKSSKNAGGTSGEARADSYVAGSKRYYADLQLGRVFTFDEDWYASGKMDFLANSASDGGMFLGFFDTNSSFQNQTQVLAGFLLVNGDLTVRFERRPDISYLDSSNFGLWVNDDRIFTLEYDADGGGVGTGRLTGTLIKVSDGTRISKFVDIPHSAVVGAQLNAFGFYATDVFPGRQTDFDWVVDDLSYGLR